MFTRRRKLTVAFLAIGITALFAFGSAAGFWSQGVTVENPETINDADSGIGSLTEPSDSPSAPSDAPIVPPRLVYPDADGYSAYQSNGPIMAPDGRAVAQLTELPSTLTGSIAVDFADLPEPAGNEVGFSILASVRYSSTEHELIVTTTRATAAAEQHSYLFGSTTVRLSDGSKAWASTNTDIFPDTPNELVFMRDSLIITLTSDLSIDELSDLATRVSIAAS